MKNLDFEWLTDEFMLYCRSAQGVSGNARTFIPLAAFRDTAAFLSLRTLTWICGIVTRISAR